MGLTTQQTGSGLRARCTSRAVSSVSNRGAYHRCIASRPKGASRLHVGWRVVRGLTSLAESNRDRSGVCFARPKQWASGFFEPFTLDALGLLSKPPRFTQRPRGARARLRTSDWEDSVKPLLHRLQPRARSPRELYWDKDPLWIIALNSRVLS